TPPGVSDLADHHCGLAAAAIGAFAPGTGADSDGREPGVWFDVQHRLGAVAGADAVPVARPDARHRRRGRYRGTFDGWPCPGRTVSCRPTVSECPGVPPAES